MTTVQMALIQHYLAPGRMSCFDANPFPLAALPTLDTLLDRVYFIFSPCFAFVMLIEVGCSRIFFLSFDVLQGCEIVPDLSPLSHQRDAKVGA